MLYGFLSVILFSKEAGDDTCFKEGFPADADCLSFDQSYGYADTRVLYGYCDKPHDAVYGNRGGVLSAEASVEI